MNDLTGGNLGRNARRGAKALSRSASALIALQVATEAAFALQAIYIAVGNQRAAQEIAEKWLVL